MTQQDKDKQYFHPAAPAAQGGLHKHGHDHKHDEPHGHGHDHAHDHGPDVEGDIEDHPLWQRDNVILQSVGIDIGSSGTQILFSHLHLQRQAVDLSSRYMVVARETWYESPVSLTPYQGETSIDDRALGEIVDNAYNAARVDPDDIDTGVVILTGEALRRENSERIGRILSEKCGQLVCVAAGHHIEAMLAAHGSGAAQASYDRSERVLNIDIGGGTTKLSLIDKGKVLSTAAIHIGGRLLAIDDSGRIIRIEPAGQDHARRAGFDWQLGDQVSAEQLDVVADSMAEDLVHALTDRPAIPEIAALYLTDPLPEIEHINSMLFSGGVAEYIYAREQRDFGDLGKRLGAAIRKRILAGALPWKLLEDSQGIRSTALGASEYTAQLSGNTCYISDPETLLPKRNLQVLHTEFDFTELFEADKLGHAIQQQMIRFNLAGSNDDLVLSLHWQGLPDFSRISALAEGIKIGIGERISRGKPLYVILDADIALTLGAVLREDCEIENDIMVIDGIALWDFDFIDLGRVRQPSATVPVTIKSLVFNDIADGPRKHERIHARPQIPVRN
jgi:ethanolamine utilization protein EutA